LHKRVHQKALLRTVASKCYSELQKVLYKKEGNFVKTIQFDYEQSCQIAIGNLNILEERLQPEIERVYNARLSNYDTVYASINLSFDQDLLKTIHAAAVKTKKSLQPTTLVVIGIGGSNLGTIAVLEAVRGKFYNEHHDISVYFVDTVDTDHVNDIGALVERELATGNNIILNVISKSGTTTETIANFEIFLEILKSHRPYNYHNFVVATTDKDSALWKLAQQEKFAYLAIPDNVGGRYSVLSAVGLFPLCFLGIDIENLCAGAQSGFLLSTQKQLSNNPAASSAALIATHYKRGNIIHDTFLFSVALASIGAWYRQLSAESIGKAYDTHNNLINTGVLPTISIGSTDLHSVAQLYLAGPYNRFTTFVSVEQNTSHTTLPHYEEFEALVPHIQGKPLTSIMDAILEGTKKAYLHDNRPFVSVALPEKSAYYLGQFMQIKMIEIMYLGFLLNVNPFDQPQVESYKKETKNILSKN
jgi:glucose-6-phosphate isomerase